uniref:Uncharacterized protein n=1 Tax=Arundo donax TaxID=35708 RepID=A0A0A8YE39_ARUDO
MYYQATVPSVLVRARRWTRSLGLSSVILVLGSG